MQSNVLMAISLCGCGGGIKGQGNNTRVRYTSTKIQKLDERKMVKETLDEIMMVELTKSVIAIIPAGNRSEELAGIIDEVSCLWKDAFNAGKTIIDTRLINANGNDTAATITIEGADGKITILLETKECPSQNMRLLVDRHEELN